MDELSLIKLLLGSVLMLCVLRLFIVAFLGDGQAGPVIGRLLRGRTRHCDRREATERRP